MQNIFMSTIKLFKSFQYSLKLLNQNVIKMLVL